MTNRVYSATVNQWNNAVANQVNTFIEISIPASTTIKIRRIETTGSRGDDTGSNGHYWLLKYMVTSATAGDTFASYTPIPRDPNISASACTVKVRNNNTLVNAPGTTITTLDTISIWTNLNYEWVAIDNDDCFTITGAAFFVLARADSTGVGTGFNCYVQWEEL